MRNSEFRPLRGAGPGRDDPPDLVAYYFVAPPYRPTVEFSTVPVATSDRLCGEIAPWQHHSIVI